MTRCVEGKKQEAFFFPRNCSAPLDYVSDYVTLIKAIYLRAGRHLASQSCREMRGGQGVGCPYVVWRKEKQNENDLILSRETLSHWVVIVVQLLGEKRAAFLFLGLLSYEMITAEQLESRTLVFQVLYDLLLSWMSSPSFFPILPALTAPAFCITWSSLNEISTLSLWLTHRGMLGTQ